MASLRALVRRGEDYLFGWLAEAEYRLKITPRGTRLVPSRGQRWMLRVFVAAATSLALVFTLTSGATRTRAFLALSVVGLLVALGALWWDARQPLPRTERSRR